MDSVTTTYVLDTASSLTMVLVESTGEDHIYYLHGLDLVAQSDTTTTEYFGYDGLGSVRQVFDAAGDPVMTQTFDPYGSRYGIAGPEAVTSVGYTGEFEDGNGLLFLRARYYSPGSGRFLNADPSRLEVNPYQYAAGNPLLYADPSGLCADPAALIYDGIPEREGGVPCMYRGSDGQIVTNTWNSDLYGGCQKCHAAHSVGLPGLYSDELAAYDRGVRKAHFSGAATCAASVPIALCLANPAACGPILARAGQVAEFGTGAYAAGVAWYRYGTGTPLTQAEIDLSLGVMAGYELYLQHQAAGAIARSPRTPEVGGGDTYILPPHYPRTIYFPGTQVQSKFDSHAMDFGIFGNWNMTNKAAFEAALRAHVEDATTLPIAGTYRNANVIHYFNPLTELNVMTDLNGNYISGWKLNEVQIWHVTTTGRLGGG